MTWTFGLCDLAGVPIGPITKAYERNLTLSLNGLHKASVRLRLDDPLVDQISTRNGDVMLKVYDGSTLRFIGDLTTAEETTEEDGKASVACNFAGPLWRLSKRLTGKLSAYNPIYTNAGTIAQTMITTTNAEKDTGVRIGTNTLGWSSSAGPWAYKPISEALTELASTAVIPYSVVDDFSQVQVYPDVALTGLTLPSGGTWTGAGDTDDFYVEPAGHTAYRNAVSDVDSNTGRYAIAPTTFNTVTVQMAFKRGVITETLSTGNAIYQGLIAAYADTNNWVQFRTHIYKLTGTWHYTMELVKRVAGTVTVIATSADPLGFLIPTDTGVDIRLTIDTTGAYQAWIGWIGTELTSIFSGTDSGIGTLATAGGKVGIFDAKGDVDPVMRQYDNFQATSTTVPQGFDFELVPSEPTADSNQSGVVGAGLKIATLNLSPVLGTSKPSVIFEYGDGHRSVKSYKRVLSRESLVTQGFSLPTNFPDNADVRARADATEIANRGLYEEVIPADLVDGSLRQALVDEHLAVRKIPRQIITFEPSSTAPVFGTDYVVGDYITGRAKVGGNSRFNALFRVYSVDIQVDDEGKADVSPTLVPS